MVKFKNHVLSVLIAIAFSFSQIVNVHANHFKNCSQKEEISVSVLEKNKKKIINTVALYLPSLNYGSENETITGEKIVKVFEPITLGFFTSLGAFGFGFFTGSFLGIITGIIGWAIGKLQITKKTK
ncbi:hypothetical protein [Bartonella vinsonii]|uniref:hypothetical protein n=1 Tax=Bartonella vinsonii TaxID=33047 RepID=UPI0002B6E53B|nr:hypothetical protein [Bartonella vinsonii]AGF75490.1 hypothetical protein BVwin_03470 [Bartonella vinsonii subsp. berkhoffii str. Winnie]